MQENAVDEGQEKEQGKEKDGCRQELLQQISRQESLQAGDVAELETVYVAGETNKDSKTDTSAQTTITTATDARVPVEVELTSIPGQTKDSTDTDFGPDKISVPPKTHTHSSNSDPQKKEIDQIPEKELIKRKASALHKFDPKRRKSTYVFDIDAVGADLDRRGSFLLVSLGGKALVQVDAFIYSQISIYLHTVILQSFTISFQSSEHAK